MSTLTLEQRRALDLAVADGVAGYVQRLRAEHGVAFTHNATVASKNPARYPDGWIYTGCRCGEPGCSYPLLLAHIDDCIAAYNAKVQDFAAETRRSSGLAARVEHIRASCKDRIDDLLVAASKGFNSLGGPQEAAGVRWVLDRIDEDEVAS